MKRRKQATKKQNRKQGSVRRRVGLTAALLAALLFVGLLGWMAISARVTHVRSAVVYLEDLPAQLDGTTALFISDFKIRGAADARKAQKLMKKLSALKPDLLLLGGDYCGGRLLDGRTTADEDGQAAALAFLRSLNSFPAPLGKYAVAGEEDAVLSGLREAMAEGGVILLDDGCATVERNGGQLILAGLSDVRAKRTPYGQIGSYFDGGECVLALSHSPAGYVGIRVAEARNGGAWADLVLTGHTLGGQIHLLGRTIYTLPEAEARHLRGWYYAGDLPMLVSQGVGCSGAMLRLGTNSEVWLLTLRRPGKIELPDF